MERRIILENRTTDLTDQFFMEKVIEIMKLGRISNNNKQYCYLIAFELNGFYYHIASYLNKKSDKFILYKVLRS